MTQKILGHSDLVTTDMETGDSLPISQKPYNLSMKHTSLGTEGVRDTGKGRHYSPKCWACPILVVPKWTQLGETP